MGDSRERSRRPTGRAALLLAALLLALVAASWASERVLGPALGPGGWAAQVGSVREAVAATGAFAPAVYFFFVTIEVVVAPLPGFLLYGPGGALFGGFWGGTLALAGNTLGSVIAFLIARRVGRERADAWLREVDLSRLEHKLAERGLLVVFLLRVNPLTSSDLVSYAAGVTSMPLGRMVLGTALGLAPLCFLQAYAAEGLLDRYPWLLGPAIAAGVAYLAAGFVFVLRVVRRPSAA